MDTQPAPDGLKPSVPGSLLGLLASILGAGGALFLGWPGALAAILLAGLLGAFLAAPLFRPAGRGEAAPVAQAAPAADEKLVLSPDRVDELTGLANANGLSAWFVEKAPHYAEENLALVVLSAELDDFEPLARSRGKAVADAVLIEVSRRVAVFGGERGVAARTGTGGEFAATATVVKGDAASIAADYAGKLAEMIQRPVELPAGAVWIGGSVGASFGPAKMGEEVLAKARSARGRAARMGRGHFAVEGPGS